MKQTPSLKWTLTIVVVLVGLVVAAAPPQRMDRGRAVLDPILRLAGAMGYG